jgi:hypothetical protein
VLARAVETNPTDEKLKSNMVALQNEKKLKMKAYSPEWYQFHLEKPPMDFGGAAGASSISAADEEPPRDAGVPRRPSAGRAGEP